MMYSAYHVKESSLCVYIYNETNPIRVNSIFCSQELSLLTQASKALLAIVSTIILKT